MPEEGIYKHNLLLLDNAYVSEGDEWKLGDIKITYSYIDKDEILSISAKPDNNILELTKGFKVIK